MQLLWATDYRAAYESIEEIGNAQYFPNAKTVLLHYLRAVENLVVVLHGQFDGVDTILGQGVVHTQESQVQKDTPLPHRGPLKYETSAKI